ncbi:MAG: ABC transporter ATP-binding protein [Sphingobacteriaceae bacterium]|nr:ABC transporter ATP-binding protein [Sphingobacteriaceae bacterium]
MTETTKNKGLNFALLKRILSYIRSYKLLFFGALTITLLLSALSIVRPVLINKALNSFVVSNSTDELNNYALLILGFLIFEALAQILNIRFTNLLGQNIIFDLRNQVYKHLISLKNAYFDNTPVGMLVTRSISDIESLSEVFSQGFIMILGDLLMLIIFIAAMFWSNWVLALMALSTIPLLFIATALFKRGIKKTFTMVRNAVSDLNTFAQERITGMKLVQLFNREKEEFENFKEINNKHRQANIQSIFYYSVFFPVVDILSSVSIALVIWFAGVKSNVYQISLGDITFFVMMVNMIFRPIRMLADRLNTLQMGIVAAERVFKILDTDEKIENTGTIPFTGVKNKIEFKNVYFSYNPNFEVLNALNLSVNAGETIALVGSTGSGKTTVINLLSRFYEKTKGEILIDEIMLENYDLSSLRLNTGVVLQDVHLFNDTLLNNITLKNPDYSLSQVEEATREIGLMDFVDELPGGFNYQVTERGQGLSAGQRQLVAFIRAYIYNPALFVLDEATAAIDSKTEQLIQKASEKLASGRTSIIIAHRLSTIKHVNCIYVFEKGKVIESGTLNQLLEQNGYFKKLYETSSDA